MSREKIDFVINEILELNKQLTFENTMLKAELMELTKLKEQMEESLMENSKVGVQDDN